MNTTILLLAALSLSTPAAPKDPPATPALTTLTPELRMHHERNGAELVIEKYQRALQVSSGLVTCELAEIAEAVMPPLLLAQAAQQYTQSQVGLDVAGEVAHGIMMGVIGYQFGASALELVLNALSKEQRLALCEDWHRAGVRLIEERRETADKPTPSRQWHTAPRAIDSKSSVDVDILIEDATQEALRDSVSERIRPHLPK